MQGLRRDKTQKDVTFRGSTRKKSPISAWMKLPRVVKMTLISSSSSRLIYQTQTLSTRQRQQISRVKTRSNYSLSIETCRNRQKLHTQSLPMRMQRCSPCLQKMFYKSCQTKKKNIYRATMIKGTAWSQINWWTSRWKLRSIRAQRHIFK